MFYDTVKFVSYEFYGIFVCKILLWFTPLFNNPKTSLKAQLAPSFVGKCYDKGVITIRALGSAGGSG